MLPAIEIEHISKSFGFRQKKNKVLADLTLTINQGEVFGFLGPNGAGKSTTIKLLLNFIRPDSGTLRIHGHTVGRDEFRNTIGYLSEFPCFYEHLTARETLSMSGQLSSVEPHRLVTNITKLLASMNLAEAADRRVGGFSKGMKQRLGMANALIHDPQLLIFDEPMSGLDPLGRHLMKNIIGELKNEGKTIFFSSHILSDIEDLCDRIGIVHKGQLLYSGGLAEFVGNESLEDRFVTVIEESDRAGIN
jgi:ABC-2 type transport system ATP-binding protein